MFVVCCFWGGVEEFQVEAVNGMGWYIECEVSDDEGEKRSQPSGSSSEWFSSVIPRLNDRHRCTGTRQ